MKILAIIPARSGSKTVPHKNIKSLNGKPLLAYSIEHALQSSLINRIIVSTDDDYYAEIARSFGAETPFLRPKNLSEDNSNDRDVFMHALHWLKNNESYLPDICVQLRPTHPVRKISDIDKMILMLIENPDADSVRSVIKNNTYTPYKMWRLKPDCYLEPLLSIEGVKEPYNQPRQSLPETYFQNASIDVIRSSTILNKESLTGDKILGFEMEKEFDIDTEQDFERVRSYLAVEDENKVKYNKTYCIDIDGVIAALTPNNNYYEAIPLTDNIEKINRLYDAGNQIILFTARGSKTKKDWEGLTKKQLSEWGVKYHTLKFGKPAADFYIDDKLIRLEQIKRI